MTRSCTGASSTSAPQSDDDEGAVIALLGRVDRVKRQVVAEERAAAAAEEARAAAQATLDGVRAKLAQLEVAMMLYRGDHDCDMAALETEAQRLEDQRPKSSGVAARWRPLVRAEAEAAPVRAAEAASAAVEATRVAASRLIAAEGERIRRDLHDAQRRHDEARRSCSSLDAAISAVDAKVAALERDGHAQDSGDSFALARRTLLALFEALGTPQQHRLALLWCIEEALPASAPALDRYRREMGRLSLRRRRRHQGQEPA